MRPTLLLRLAVLSLLGACTSGAEVEPTELDVSCTGKCDGVDSIRSLYQDARDLDLSDLAARGTDLASGELADALSGDFLDVELDEPVAFGSAALAAEESAVEDLEALTSGLLTRFGEGELSTEVNETRLRHLASSGDDVFVESGFSLRASLDHGFNIGADGFEDASVRVGLGSVGISGRVINATERGAATSPEAILDGVRSARGFVIPQEVEDLRSMKPGEAFALSGEGVFGLNLGAGVPIVVAAAGPLTYNLVVSGALRAQIEGLMDVQLVRLEGDSVVVDIGTEGARVRSAQLAINDGWGVSGLVSSTVELAGQTVDLGRLLDRALKKRLDDRLNLLGAEFERTSRRSRLSVTRVRFDLGAPGIEDALAQALRGDARMAQALADRAGSGVILDYDISRSGLSTVSHAGVELFGMRFFNSTFRSEGGVVVSTPGGAQELLFDTLQRESGWLFESHGHGRVALSGLRFDGSEFVESEVNLFVQVMEGDRYMQRDTLLDHLDSLISAVGGPEALAAIEGPGNDLQRLVEDTCAGGGAFDPCREEVLTNGQVVALRAEGLAALESATSGLTPSVRTLLREAGTLRLAAQATVEPAAALVGPPTGIVLDYRLDDRSVERIFAEQEGADLRAALLQILETLRVDREDSESDIANDRDDLADDEAETLDAMAELFEAHSEIYQSLTATEHAEIQGLGIIGGRALAIELEGGPIDYDNATARSIVQARSENVRDAFDGLLELARDFRRVRQEHVLGYALLAMLPAGSVDARMSVEMDLSNRAAQDYDHYRAAGQASFDAYGQGDLVELIGGGVFDVEALIEIN